MPAGRVELATNQPLDGGPNNTYQDQRRNKPQYNYIALLLQGPLGGPGAHNPQGRRRLAARSAARRQRSAVRHLLSRSRRRARRSRSLQHAGRRRPPTSTIRASICRDDWKLTNRLTLNLGLRIEHYVDGWPEQKSDAERHSGARGHQRSADHQLPRRPHRRRAQRRGHVRRPARASASPTTSAATGRQVVKGYYGRFYFNSADIVADNENPVGRRVAALPDRRDLNGNRLLDGPHELGAFLQTIGGAGFVRVDPNLKRPVRRGALRPLRARGRSTA